MVKLDSVLSLHPESAVEQGKTKAGGGPTFRQALREPGQAPGKNGWEKRPMTKKEGKVRPGTRFPVVG